MAASVVIHNSRLLECLRLRTRSAGPPFQSGVYRHYFLRIIMRSDTSFCRSCLSIESTGVHKPSQTPITLDDMQITVFSSGVCLRYSISTSSESCGGTNRLVTTAFTIMTVLL